MVVDLLATFPYYSHYYSPPCSPQLLATTAGSFSCYVIGLVRVAQYGTRPLHCCCPEQADVRVQRVVLFRVVPTITTTTTTCSGVKC
jgi:hypothetical protein